MDPLGIFSDEKIWACLKTVKLDDKIRSFANQLDEEVQENGALM
jgi:ABC-type multidrug transport system fused ATPase/permease subunit